VRLTRYLGKEGRFKYYGFDAGLAAINSSQLGFRCPRFFNDPFELTSLFDRQALEGSGGFVGIAINSVVDNVVICSLTRSYDNELMWSHYASDHEGFVVEYDMNDKFLSSNEYCLIPAYEGAVIYHNKKSTRPLKSADLDRLHDIYLQSLGSTDFPSDDRGRALARQLFLTKKACWSYEEEVRIVKVKDSFFQESYDFQSDKRRGFYTLTTPMDFEWGPGYVGRIPGLIIYDYKVKIKNIYLGVRNKLQVEDAAGLVDKWRKRKIGTYCMQIDKAGWFLRRSRFV